MNAPVDGDRNVASSHPLLPARTRVTVFGLALTHRPFIEGKATIISPVPGFADAYNVRFTGERVTRQRLMLPGDWQTDPQAQLRRMLLAWRLTLTPELLTQPFPTDR